MTEQQTTAITNPCELAEQCINQRYFKTRRVNNLHFSIGLTLNVGYE